MKYSISPPVRTEIPHNKYYIMIRPYIKEERYHTEYIGHIVVIHPHKYLVYIYSQGSAQEGRGGGRHDAAVHGEGQNGREEMIPIALDEVAGSEKGMRGQRAESGVTGGTGKGMDDEADGVVLEVVALSGMLKNG